MSWWDDLLQAIADALNGVKDQLAGLIGGGIDGVQGSLDWIYQQLLGSITGGQTDLTNLINGIFGQLDGSIGQSQNFLAELIRNVTGGLLDNIDALSTDVFSASNGVITSINGAINGGLSNVINNLYNATTTITGGINSGINSVQSALNSVEQGLGGAINGGINSVQSALSGARNGIETTIVSSLNSVQAGITGLIGDVANGIDTGLREVGNLVSSVGESVSASLANLSPDLGAIAEAITTGKPIQDGIDALNRLVVAGLGNAFNGLDLAAQNKQQAWAKILSGEVTQINDVVALLFDPPPDEGVLGRIVEIISAVVGAATMYSQMGGVLARERVQEFNMRHLTEVPSPEFFAQAVVQSQITPDQARDFASRWGYRSDIFDLLVNVAGSPPGLGELLEMWRRDFIDESTVDQAVRESRLKTKYLGAIKRLRYQLPPISDVIRMAVRDAWNDQVSARYGYDEDMPGEVARIAPQLGIDADWVKRYWRAHWTLPSVEQLFAMLHRSRETGVDRAMVDEALRVNDVPKFWRDKLIAISYSPFTRVDVRRMYKTGVLNYDQVVQSYREIGYDETRAKALADFTVKLEDATGQLNPDALERQIFSALQALFVRGKRTEQELRAAMTRFGWGAQAIENEIEIAKLRQEAYNKVESKDVSGLTATTVQRQLVERQIDLYVRNRAGIDSVSSLMSEFGWSEEIQTLMLRRALMDKEYDASPTQKQQLRDLSQSAILEAYEAHTFTADEARARLVDLGIDATDAQILIDIKDYQQATAIRNRIVAAIQKAFIQNRLSEAQATSQLMQFGFTQQEASGYMALWTLDKSLQHKDFTEAQLATFLKRGVIEADEYKRALGDLGWSPQQIDLWARLRGADSSIV